MSIHTVPRPSDRRDLDTVVRKVYDELSSTGDYLSRSHYEALIRGGANALHRFGSIVVPRPRPDYAGEVHVIKIIECVCTTQGYELCEAEQHHDERSAR